MELGLSAKTGVASIALPRVDAPASQQAVKTDLPPSRAVTAIAESEATRLDISDHARTLLAAEPAGMRNVVTNMRIDPDTQQVVLQYLDKATRQLVRQVPEEELLRFRAYIRTLFETSRSPAEPKIERSA